jgi:hypothetical protein
VMVAHTYAGTAVPAARQYSDAVISQQTTFFKWRSKHGGVGVQPEAAAGTRAE